MPAGILNAYNYCKEELVIYNTIARGVGKPYSRRCGVPQGCPLSMILIALMMRPWVALMLALDLVPWILADDICFASYGKDMFAAFTNGMHVTHVYLYHMGATLAPTKSYNFASTRYAGQWLAATMWPSIPGPVAVLNDFRYLGAHISITGKTNGRTLTNRFRKAIAMLKRLASMPLSMEAKTKAIKGNIHPMALYGIAVACPCERLPAKFTAAVMQVIGGHTKQREVDILFSAVAGEGEDLDPDPPEE